MTAQSHLQLLYAAALEFLDQPFPPEGPTQAQPSRPSAPATAVRKRPAAEQQQAVDNQPEAGSAQHPDEDSELRELLGLDDRGAAAEQQSALKPAALPAAQSAAVYVVYALWSAQPQPATIIGEAYLAQRPQNAPKKAKTSGNTLRMPCAPKRRLLFMPQHQSSQWLPASVPAWPH